MTKRDVQRQKVYRADTALASFRSGKSLASVASIRLYLVGVCEKKRVAASFPRIDLDEVRQDIVCYKTPIHHGGGTSVARGGAHRLNFPLWARTDGTVLHEFAHHLHEREKLTYLGGAGPNDDTYWQVHGWRFVEILSILVLHVLGRDAHDAYKAACKEHRVRSRPKRKLSPEALEKLRARGRLLAAARIQSP